MEIFVSELPEVIFCVDLRTAVQLCASMQVGKCADAETVRRMKLELKELTARITNFR